MGKQQQTITFQVTFNLTDFDKLVKSYPNFAYNYPSFADWAKANVNAIRDTNKGVKGCKISVKRIKA